MPSDEMSCTLEMSISLYYTAEPTQANIHIFSTLKQRVPSFLGGNRLLSLSHSFRFPIHWALTGFPDGRQCRRVNFSDNLAHWSRLHKAGMEAVSLNSTFHVALAGHQLLLFQRG